MTDDDAIIEQRIRGRSARAIAKAQACSVRDVNLALDRFAEATIDDKTRKHTLALELARIDAIQTVFYARALEGDVQCGALVAKLIERRCVILGLSAPPTATFTVIDQTVPKETSSDRIRAAIDRIRSKKNRAIEGEVVKEDDSQTLGESPRPRSDQDG